MNIILNGQNLETNASTVAELIANSPMAGKPVVVEYNKEALPASAHKTTGMKEGDSLEVLVLGAGG